MDWLIFVGLMGLAGAVVGAVRNQLVYFSRLKVIERIRGLCIADIAADRSWKWRYGLLDRVSYEEQLFKFWRSPSSFFDDADELRP